MPDMLGLTQLQSLIIDMDGVLYRGGTPIEGARECLEFLRETGIPFCLLTNNSTLTSEQYSEKLARMDISARAEDILTSAEATAVYLERVASPGTRVYVIGEDGIRAELAKRGFVLTDDRDVAYVVVGWDRQFTYDKLAVATLAIRAGAQYIATNPDKTFPSEIGLMPGAGALLAAIETATDTAPLVIGKPQPAIFELALERLGAQPATTAVIGDRIETDILGARELGLRTILVMSGVTDAQQLAEAPLVADMVFDDINAVYRAWRAAMRGRA
jgi:4-nitrophenyl phosphatase